MGRFLYKAIDSSGQYVKDSISAGSIEEASAKIEAEGLYPVDVRADKTRLNFGARKHISQDVLLKLAKQLAILNRTGLTMKQILEIIKGSQRNKALEDALTTVERELKSGQSLRNSFELGCGDVSPMFYAAISAGEASGDLSSAMSFFAHVAERRQKIRAKMRKAAVYPIFLMGLLIVVLGIVFQFVLPRFEDLYAEFGADLPTTTRVLLAFSSAFPFVILGMGGVLVLTWIALQSFKSNTSFMIKFHKFLYKIPALGGYLRLVSQFEFISLLELMFKSGTPVYRAVLFAAENSGNLYFAEQLSQLGSKIKKGESFDRAVEDLEVLDFETKYMLAVGERSGTLSEMLGEASNETNEKLDQRADALIELMEPLFLVVVGGIIGFIVIAIYMPMLTASEIVG